MSSILHLTPREQVEHSVLTDAPSDMSPPFAVEAFSGSC